MHACRLLTCCRRARPSPPAGTTELFNGTQQCHCYRKWRDGVVDIREDRFYRSGRMSVTFYWWLGHPYQPLKGRWAFPPFNNGTACEPGRCEQEDYEMPFYEAVRKVGRWLSLGWRVGGMPEEHVKNNRRMEWHAGTTDNAGEKTSQARSSVALVAAWAGRRLPALHALWRAVGRPTKLAGLPICLWPPRCQLDSPCRARRTCCAGHRAAQALCVCVQRRAVAPHVWRGALVPRGA